MDGVDALQHIPPRPEPMSELLSRPVEDHELAPLHVGEMDHGLLSGTAERGETGKSALTRISLVQFWRCDHQQTPHFWLVLSKSDGDRN